MTVVGLGVSILLHSRLRGAYAEVDYQCKLTEAALAGERRFLYYNRILFASGSSATTTPMRQACSTTALRRTGAGRNYLKRQRNTELLTIPLTGPHPERLVSLDGWWIATGAEGTDEVRIWDAATGQQVEP